VNQSWQIHPLAELLEIMENGSRPKGGVASFDSGVPSIGGEHLNRDGGFSLDNIRFVPRTFFLEMKKGIIRPQDILLVKDGATTGKTSFVSEGFPYKEAAINEHVFLLRANRAKVSPRYLFFFLFSPVGQRQILSSFQGAAIGGIPQSFARVTNVPVPPLPEQERIRRILDAAEELRRVRAQADRRTADLIPALFYDMFGDPAPNPKRWELKRLGQVGKLDRGRSRHRPRDEPSLYGGPYPFIQTGDVANSSGLITGYSQTYSELGLAQSRIWPAGTLCITIAANIAKTGILTFEACFPDSVVGFIPNEGVLVEYVREWFVTMETRLEEAAPQAAQKNINLGILNSLLIPVPPFPLQRQFAARVAEIRALEARQAESRRRLDDVFQSLLHHAFQGEL